MTDIAQLETELLGAVAEANDEAALEAVRVAALGKSGSVSALLKTLGSMTPEERKTNGPAINGLKDKVTQAIAARKQSLGNAALDARLNSETHRRHPAGTRSSDRIGPRPPDQPGDRRAHRDLRRYGLRGGGRPRRRDRRLQLHQAQFPRGPSGPRDARHVLLPAEAGRLAHVAAHAYVASAGAHHADAEAADPRHHSGPHLPQRLATRRTRRCSIRSRDW